MKKILKSKILWSVLVIAVVGVGAYAQFGKQEEVVTYDTERITQQELTQTVSATGKVKSSSEIKLNFRDLGRLSAVPVKVGDRVVPDAIIAQLRSVDQMAQVRKAQADVAQIQAELSKLKAGATQQDIVVSEAAVASAERDVAVAQTDLDNTTAIYESAIVDKQEALLFEIKGALTLGNITLQKINDVLEYEGDERNFKTLNIALETQVRNEYEEALRTIDGAELTYNQALIDVIGSMNNKTDQAAADMMAALSEIKTLLADLGRLLDDVVVTTVLTREELDVIKTDINTQKTTVDSTMFSVRNARQALSDARLDLTTKVATAEIALTVAQQRLEKAKAELAFKKAPSRPEDIAATQARLLRAQAELQSAQDSLDDTVLRAPVAGTIIDVNYEVGEQVTASEPVVVMLAMGAYEVEVDIPESDIAKIEIGDTVRMTLDAFDDAVVFSGKVTTINPAQTEIQDVIYYRVTVLFDTEQQSLAAQQMDKIKPGMTANVDILTAQLSSVLVVPIRAIRDVGGVKKVDVLIGGQPQERIIELGLRGDGSVYEVKSGLYEGDAVIVFTRNGK